MAEHEKFSFQTLGEVREKARELGLSLPCTEELSPLFAPVTIGARTAPNAMAVLPMEGCDGAADGAPGELTVRRYRRFAAGGAGLLWWEACAVVPEGRANPRQLMLTEANAGAFSALVRGSREAARSACGDAHTPVNILQLTHSGRYARPVGHAPAPIIPQHDPLLDAPVGLSGGEAVCSDAYLDSLVEKYVHSALLAQQAGFDGVDIKACHRYLMSELLASHTRAGRYGGSFENRTRLLLTVVREVKKAVGPDFIVACRFNVFDAHPYPYGFGVSRDDFQAFDPAEPLRLVRELTAAGVQLLSNSAGNPYYIYPQVTRPFDVSSMGIPVPQEHPLESVARLFDFTRQIQVAAGPVPVVGNGYTWLRQFAPYFGAANIRDGGCRLMGLGRQSFAYPDAPHDLVTKGTMQPEKCCVTCSRCTQIMRDHGCTGCVVRDAAVYAPLYRQYRAEAAAREGKA